MTENNAINFAELMLDSIYESGIETPATLIIQGSAGGEYPISVIDHTSGLAVSEPAGNNRIVVETIKPVATMRQTELACRGLIVTDLANAQLTIMHDDVPPVTWGIKSYLIKPTPSGAGEIELILIDLD